MVRILLQLPVPLKAKLDAERKRGTSAAGLIRHLLGSISKARRRRNHVVERRSMSLNPHAGELVQQAVTQDP